MVSLSIVLPVFNRAEWVKVMVDSIFNQTYQDWELLIIDDGSSEETLSLLKEYEPIDKVKVFHRDILPKGAQTCRNIGLNNAKGEFIVFLDSDDWMPKFALEQRVEYMQSHNELDFAVFPFTSFKNQPYDNLGPVRGGVNIKGDDLEYFLYASLPFAVWTNIYRRESLVHKGIKWDINIKSLQDSDFNINSILSGFKYEYASNAKVDYYFRFGVSSEKHISSKIASEEHINSHLYFVDKLLSRISNTYRRIQKRTLRWLFASKILLQPTNKQYISRLYDIAKKYNLDTLVTLDIYLISFLCQRMKLSCRIARWLVYPAYAYKIRKLHKTRFRIVSSILNKSQYA